MKKCVKCGEENEDSYLYCAGCASKLPSKEALQKRLDAVKRLLNEREYREAFNKCKALLEMNEGDKEAWFIRGVCAMHFKMADHARECFYNAGVQYDQRRCDACDGRGICRECGDDSRCFMCKGAGHCTICEGSGECIYCLRSLGRCNACGGTEKCPSCKGSGQCPECQGLGSCYHCKGKKKCYLCGGSGRSFVLNESTVPVHLRAYMRIMNE